MSKNPLNGVETSVRDGRGLNMTLGAHSFALKRRISDLVDDDSVLPQVTCVLGSARTLGGLTWISRRLLHLPFRFAFMAQELIVCNVSLALFRTLFVHVHLRHACSEPCRSVSVSRVPGQGSSSLCPSTFGVVTNDGDDIQPAWKCESCRKTSRVDGSRALRAADSASRISPLSVDGDKRDRMRQLYEALFPNQRHCCWRSWACSSARFCCASTKSSCCALAGGRSSVRASGCHEEQRTRRMSDECTGIIFFLSSPTAVNLCLPIQASIRLKRRRG